MKNKQKEYSFGMDEQITPDEFLILQSRVSSALSQVYGFGVNNLPVKGKIKEKMQSIFDQVEKQRNEWRYISLNKPNSAFKSWLIINYMKNIVKLGDIHNFLHMEYLVKLRR